MTSYTCFGGNFVLQTCHPNTTLSLKHYHRRQGSFQETEEDKSQDKETEQEKKGETTKDKKAEEAAMEVEEKTQKDTEKETTLEIFRGSQKRLFLKLDIRYKVAKNRSKVMPPFFTG